MSSALTLPATFFGTVRVPRSSYSDLTSTGRRRLLLQLRRLRKRWTRWTHSVRGGVHWGEELRGLLRRTSSPRAPAPGREVVLQCRITATAASCPACLLGFSTTVIAARRHLRMMLLLMMMMMLFLRVGAVVVMMVVRFWRCGHGVRGHSVLRSWRRMGNSNVVRWRRSTKIKGTRIGRCCGGQRRRMIDVGGRQGGDQNKNLLKKKNKNNKENTL
jgi:hypothetical protein